MALSQPMPAGAGMDTIASNSILAALPASMSLGQAKRAFKKFGDIESIELLPGQDPAVCVAYYDVRAANFAFQALGGLRYCQPGPPSGDRSVRLSGKYELSHDDIKGLSMWPQADSDGSYMVQFFDVRDAERVRTASEEFPEEDEEEELEPPPGLEHLARPSAVLGKDTNEPAYNSSAKAAVDRSKGLKDVTNVSPAARPSSSHTTISIVGLPNLLCTDTCFEATIQQAGFQESVVGFTTKPGKPCGEAIVNFSSQEAAHLCMAHFQGRKWGHTTSGKEVKAWIIRDTSITTPAVTRKRCDSDTANVSTAAGSSDEECPLP
jgi:hypothetical protein